MTRAEAIAQAIERLRAVSDSPRQDAEWLLARRAGYSRAQLFARLDEPLPPSEAQAFETDIARRARGEPVAYLLGEQGFWTLSLTVTPAVLIPRPETELLVEWALALCPPEAAPAVADLGTGSGAIALALASERPRARITAVDLSREARAVARANGERLGLPVTWVEADFAEWLTGGGPPQDLILSNPPYVAAGDPHLPALRHEPLIALTDGHDGLNALRALIAAAPLLLRAEGHLLLEHGRDQAEAVRRLFGEAGFERIETRRDLAGLERATGGRWPGRA
jgi:release factor glutamine methyltransferase